MKKSLFFTALTGALLLCFGAFCEAADITGLVTFTASGNARQLGRLTDRRFDRAWAGGRGQGSLAISSPIPMHGLYIIWENQPRAFSIMTTDNQVISDYDDAKFLHQFYPLSGETAIRLSPEKDNGKNFGIKEIYILGEGEVPAWVQRWKDTYEDADMMLLFAHPDDEVLFFGGLLPYYGAERGLRVLPVLLTDAGSLRHTELLNCLWSLGIRHYPVLGPFPDRYAWELKDAYQKFGKKKATDFLIEQIRRYRPEVLVTHDIGGEYGHGAHRLCADLAIRCLQYSNDPAYHRTSFDSWGGHEIKKLYLHLYQTDAIEMDWDQPLLAFGGETGFELAREAYDRFHLSQHRYEQYHVEPRDAKNSSYRFGLYHSAVGPDILKNDMMENIEIEGGEGL